MKFQRVCALTYQPRFVELTEEVARLYAANFTEQELKDILAFYKTTAGKKLPCRRSRRLSIPA